MTPFRISKGKRKDLLGRHQQLLSQGEVNKYTGYEGLNLQTFTPSSRLTKYGDDHVTCKTRSPGHDICDEKFKFRK